MTGVALVTGGNRGLGLETCRQLAARGMHVVLTARDLAAATESVNEIGAGLSLEAVQLDVTDPLSIDCAVEHVHKADRHLEVLVNNAGIALEGFDAEVARRTIDVNVYGAERVTRALLPVLSKGARIVNVSSGSGELSNFAKDLRRRFLDPKLDREGLHDLLEEFVEDVAAGRHAKKGWPSSGYAVSKAGMNALTRIFAREQPLVHVNAVCPGWVRTDMGGPMASRSVREGAASIVWATRRDVPTGGFFRDGHPIDW